MMIPRKVYNKESDDPYKGDDRVEAMRRRLEKLKKENEASSFPGGK